MKTPVYIPENQLRLLAEIGRRRQMSRAAIIREAIAEFLSRDARQGREEAFGLWGRISRDGVEYQRSVRFEW